MSTLVALIAFTGFLLIYLKSVKVIAQNYKGLVYRLGRLEKKVLEPGFNFLIPFVDELKLISTRHEIMSIPSQNLITEDNKNLKAEAEVHFQIVDPAKTTNVADPYSALRQISQSNIHIEIGKTNSQTMGSEQESINRRIEDSLNYSAKEWGMQISKVELKNIVFG